MTARPLRILHILCALAIAGLAWPSRGAEAVIEGTGATFPAPLYLRWASQYLQDSGRIVRYAATGSGAGIERIERGLVDFGASDAPLDREAQQRHGITQFPVVIGGVVPVVNIAGLKPGELCLTGAVLSDIYLGKIVHWNDPAIVQLNPDVDLPRSNITVVHRADASGTTLLWSDYLAGASAEWKTRVGAAMSLRWPTGVAETGNEGVASSVQRVRMSIGYVEYAYAAAHHLTYASLRNRDGVYVRPGKGSFAAAAASAPWKQRADLDQRLIDQPGATSWPIVGASFILLQRRAKQPARSVAVLQFFDWALRRGAATADELDYVAMPEAATDLIRRIWLEEPEDASGRPVWVGDSAR